MTKVAAITLTILFYANSVANIMAPEPVEMHQPMRGPR